MRSARDGALQSGNIAFAHQPLINAMRDVVGMFDHIAFGFGNQRQQVQIEIGFQNCLRLRLGPPHKLSEPLAREIYGGGNPGDEEVELVLTATSAPT